MESIHTRSAHLRVDLLDFAGVEVEIIRVHGEWPARYRAILFGSSDRFPKDHTTTWDRVSGERKTGSWSASADALTLRGARKKAALLYADYASWNPANVAKRAAAAARRNAEAAAQTAAVAAAAIA